MKKISGVEKSVINISRYADYVKSLEKDGKRFPLNQFGDVNLTEIAKACGFNRQVFFTNTTMKNKLANDVKRIGTSLSKPKPSDLLLENQVKIKNTQVNSLQRDLVLAEEKNCALLKQIAELELENKNLKISYGEFEASVEHMLETGRRFSL